MQVKIEGENLVITIPMMKPARPSASGKSNVVASTAGNLKTSLIVDGQPLIIGLNAYYSTKQN